MRVIFSRADIGKIAEYRENLNSAMQKFELQSHMNIDLKLGKFSEQIRYRNGEDDKRVLEVTARQARDPEETESIHEQETKISHLKQFEIDEREHSEELKKSEDRRSELERLRADVRALEMANRLKKAEEEEILELRRKIAASRRNTFPQAQPSKNKRSSTSLDESENEKAEEESERKANPRESTGGLDTVLETFTNDDSEEPLRRKLSNSPPHFEETENQSTDEEKSPPPKKSPKGAPKADSQVDDLMAQFQKFVANLGSIPHGSRSSSQMYYPPYGSPLPPSVVPNGYGNGYGVVPETRTVINSTIRNISNSNLSNIGNNNSDQKFYRAPHNWRSYTG